MQTHIAPPAVRIVLADDHDLVRSGLKILLASIAGVQVIAEARDGLELIGLVDDLLPDIAITDISMPSGLDGLEAAARIHAKHPGVRVLVVSMYETLDFVRRAVASGACGYLMKDASAFELEKAVRAVMANGSYFSAGVARLLMAPAEPAVRDLLTERQVDVLTRIAQGQASKEIGHALGLSSKTIDAERMRIMQRLSLQDVAGLARYAARNGLVTA